MRYLYYFYEVLQTNLKITNKNYNDHNSVKSFEFMEVNVCGQQKFYWFLGMYTVIS
jgi:hypothetical protein